MALRRVVTDGGRDPELRAARGESEAARQNADDESVLPVEPDMAPDHAGCAAEARLPEAPGDQRHARRAVAVLGRGERAASDRLDPEHGEELPGHAGGIDPLRGQAVVRAGECDGAGHVTRHRLETMGELLPIEERAGRNRIEERAVAADAPLIQPGQAAGVAERERAQEHRVDDAEYGRVRP